MQRRGKVGRLGVVATPMGWGSTKLCGKESFSILFCCIMGAMDGWILTMLMLHGWLDFMKFCNSYCPTPRSWECMLVGNQQRKLRKMSERSPRGWGHASVHHTISVTEWRIQHWCSGRLRVDDLELGIFVFVYSKGKWSNHNSYIWDVIKIIRIWWSYITQVVQN